MPAIHISGISGSGKTTLARSLKHHFPHIIILETDDVYAAVAQDLGVVWDDHTPERFINKIEVKVLKDILSFVRKHSDKVVVIEGISPVFPKTSGVTRVFFIL